MKYKVGFIGCGNMGGALVKAVSLSLQKGEIAVCDQSKEKTDFFNISFVFHDSYKTPCFYNRYILDRKRIELY
jgi:pyrroline-5-carboxylate reductase